MKRSLKIVAVILGILFAMPITNNGVFATDYSGKYYVIFGGESDYTMDIRQRGLDLTFSLIGGDIAVSGSGTLNGNKMTLMTKIPMDGNIQALSTLKILATFSNDGLSYVGNWRLTGNDPINGSIAASKRRWDIYNVNDRGIPKFVPMNYIELSKISRISKFRSGAGHDSSDDFERCRGAAFSLF